MSFTENKIPKTIIDTSKIIRTEKLQGKVSVFLRRYSIRDVSIPPNVQLFSRLFNFDDIIN